MHNLILLVVFHCCNYFQTYMINHPILLHLNKQLPDINHMLFNLDAVLFYLKFPLAAFYWFLSHLFIRWFGFKWVWLLPPLTAAFNQVTASSTPITVTLLVCLTSMKVLILSIMVTFCRFLQKVSGNIHVIALFFVLL